MVDSGYAISKSTDELVDFISRSRERIIKRGIKIGLQFCDCEDCIGKTFIEVMSEIRKRGDSNPIKDIGGYVLTSFKTTCLDLCKKKYWKLPQYDSSFPVVDERALRPLDELLQEESLERLWELVDSIPPHSLEVFRLKLEGRSNKEIANRLDLPTGTVSTRVYRVREYIKEELKRESLLVS